ncbi:hypothetical protein JCM6294_2338 [Bacteroides pyogenes DSM 20611 = JCM 6294]|uniref:Uncharacterized protein n=1 Tax=Bacteroides pyogenes DSM 20611 = JCM 6294 TaxID=1121100 RepID=W4PJI3_9BACE|nr:hypothetical protein JCM6294_2338 [Bacteroides pyogenes DSM 20611 = JCM 6294]
MFRVLMMAVCLADTIPLTKRPSAVNFAGEYTFTPTGASSFFFVASDEQAEKKETAAIPNIIVRIVFITVYALFVCCK